MRILVVEDEPGILNCIKDGLEEEGFVVDVALNGAKGMEMATGYKPGYDIMLIDWMLPCVNGIEICKQVRKTNSIIPIIFLTAKDTVQDTVFALDMGANDYIKKPFSFDELFARIRVQLRGNIEKTNKLYHRDIIIDIDKHKVLRENEEIVLTHKEFGLLEFLFRNEGKVCTRTNILKHVWDIHFDYDTSVIDVYINALRKKIDINPDNSIIRTIRGVGYILNEK